MTTDIERISKRMEKNLKSINRDSMKLFDIIEERGMMIDELATENQDLQELFVYFFGVNYKELKED